MTPEPHIGTLNENPLHAALKEHLARPGALFEQRVERFVIDIIQDGELIEIQSGNFPALQKKITRLSPTYPMRIVHPIAARRWIVKLDDEGEVISRRKSPKQGSIYHLFDELVRWPAMLDTPNLSLQVLLIEEEEYRVHRPNKAWRRKGWVTHTRHLLTVTDTHIFQASTDLLALLPPELPERFTNQDICTLSGQPARTAQRMTYCLRKLALLHLVDKAGRYNLYARRH